MAEAPAPAHSAVRPSSPAASRTFAVFALLLLPVMIAASFDFGVTWDEESRSIYGRKVLDFLRGELTRADFPESGGHQLYPGLFDALGAALEPLVPLNRWVLRHIITAIFGWIGIVYTGRLATQLFGPRAGALALTLLALSPRYVGHSMNNPKDLPFAALSMVALYYISTIAPRWPFVSLSAGIKITLALALALGVRVGALLYLGYFILLVVGFVVAGRITDWRKLGDTALRLTALAISVLLLGTIFWPWAGGAPLTRPFVALFGVSEFPWEGDVLYRGFEHPSTALPWHYAPWWFLISTPPVVLAGAAASLVVFASRAEMLRKAVLWAIVAIPIALAIAKGSTLYDGVRHLLFVYPALVVVAAAGWSSLLARARSPWLRGLVATFLAIALASALVTIVRMHPNQVTYFNALVGGPKGAFKHYELDYWGNCVLQAVKWGANAARASGATVTISGTPEQLVLLNAERFPEVEFVAKDFEMHQLEVTLVRGPRHWLRQIETRPALHQVRTADGALLCTVTAGPALRDFGAAH